MTIRAEIEGGQILEFPDDTPDDVVQRVVQQTLAQRQPQRAPAPPMPTATGSALLGIPRQLGLTGRAILEGVTMLPGMIGDAANAAVNLPIRGANAVLRAVTPQGLTEQITGETSAPQIPLIPPVSQSINTAINAVTPQPETPTERVVNRMGRGLVSLGTGMGAAQAAAPLGPGAQAFSNFINTNPSGQASFVLGSDLGGGTAREMVPDSPLVEALATVAGGVGGYGAHELGRYGITLAQALAQPFRRSGQEEIVAQTMSRMATRPRSLAQALTENTDEITPGSMRTTAEVAGDPGLLAAQRTVQAIDPRARGEFALRDATRNVARNAALDTIAPPTTLQEAGNTVQRSLANALRGTASDTSRMFRQIDPAAGNFPAQAIYDDVARVANDLYARSTAGTPPQLQPILERLRNSGTLSLGDIQAMQRELGDIAGTASRAGNGTLAKAAGDMSAALMGHADDIAANTGSLLPQQLEQLAAARAARATQGATFEEGAVGRAIDTNRFGRLTMAPEDVPQAVLGGPTAGRQLATALRDSPAGMDAARAAFVQQLRSAITMSTPDAMNNPNLSAAMFNRFMAENRETAAQLFGREHMDVLSRLARDFSSRQMVDTVGRAPGSDTFQNLSVGNLIARMTGGAVSPTGTERIPGSPILNRVLGWAYGSADNAMRELLADAMLNPQLARALLQRATPASVEQAAALIETTLTQRAASGARSFVQPLVPAGASVGTGSRDRSR